MNLEEICTRLDEELRTSDFADLDGSPNGLQVGPASKPVGRAAVAVDAAAATIDAARERDADLLVVHHGLWWEGTERLVDRGYDRVAGLVEDDVALYVSHLPLDAHPELGNAAGLADVLELEDRRPFGEFGTEHIGQRGRLPAPIPRDDLVDQLEGTLDHDGAGVRALPFGPDPLEEVAIVTGSGTDFLDEAAGAGVDALLTGEGKHMAYHDARELGVTVVLAGHYATETFGVRALGDLLESWGVDVVPIDHPTGL